MFGFGKRTPLLVLGRHDRGLEHNEYWRCVDPRLFIFWALVSKQELTGRMGLIPSDPA